MLGRLLEMRGMTERARGAQPPGRRLRLLLASTNSAEGGRASTNGMSRPAVSKLRPATAGGRSRHSIRRSLVLARYL